MSFLQEISKALCELLEEYLGVPPSRVYCNFFDMGRADVGFNGGTFA